MRKIALSMVVCGVAMATACGGHVTDMTLLEGLSEAEKVALRGGKATLTFERERPTQSTAMGPESVKRAYFVYADDAGIKRAVESGQLADAERQGWSAVKIRGLDRKMEAQTFYVNPRAARHGYRPMAMDLAGMESGEVIHQSDLSCSFVDLLHHSGRTFELYGQELTAAEIVRGVRVDISVEDGETRAEVVR